MFSVGLIGQIGSGKSTVAALFQSLGVSVYSADVIAKALTKSNTPTLNRIQARFGNGVLLPSGELNRKALREIIFKNPTERQWLEALLHPLIRKEMLRLATQPSNGCYQVFEIPLLLSKTQYPYLNRILIVVADELIKVERVMMRDNQSEQQVLSILKAQDFDNRQLKLADDIIENNGTKEALKKAVEALHLRYSKLANG